MKDTAEMREGEAVATIPFCAHEMQMMQKERINKRLTWALIGAVVLTVVTNAYWVIKLL